MAPTTTDTILMLIGVVSKNGTMVRVWLYRLDPNILTRKRATWDGNMIKFCRQRNSQATLKVASTNRALPPIWAAQYQPKLDAPLMI